MQIKLRNPSVEKLTQQWVFEGPFWIRGHNSRQLTITSSNAKVVLDFQPNSPSQPPNTSTMWSSINLKTWSLVAPTAPRNLLDVTNCRAMRKIGVFILNWSLNSNHIALPDNVKLRASESLIYGSPLILSGWERCEHYKTFSNLLLHSKLASCTPFLLDNGSSEFIRMPWFRGWLLF